MSKEIAIQTERTYLEEELIWGRDYRNNSVINTPRKPLRQKVSPINIGLQLCRALQRKKVCCKDELVAKKPSPMTLLESKISTKVSKLASFKNVKPSCKIKKSSSCKCNNNNNNKSQSMSVLDQKENKTTNHNENQENKLKAKFTSSPTLNLNCKKKSSKSTPNLINKNKTKKLLESSSNLCQRFNSPSFIQRNTLSQNEYMTLLSQPSTKSLCHVKKQQRCAKKCLLQPCPPRIIQLATPQKRLVLANWQNYQHILPAEAMIRFDSIIQGSGNNSLELREARSYFKRLDKKNKKKKNKRNMFRKQRKKNHKNRAEILWYNREIDAMIECIVNYVRCEDLETITYQQMMMSDFIVAKLRDKGIVKMKNRNTKNVFESCLVEICDKIACWADKLSKFVEIKPLDSKELLTEPSAESLLEEYQEEEEEQEEEDMTQYEEEYEDEIENELNTLLDIFTTSELEDDLINYSNTRMDPILEDIDAEDF